MLGRLQATEDAMKIVDTHHHLWDLKNHYPFMHEKGRHLSGGNAILSKNYLIQDLQADMAGTHVVKSVHLQAGIEPAKSVEETAWLQGIADDVAVSGGFPHGIVARTNPADPNAEAELEQHCQYANVRGIRHLVHEYLANPVKYPDYLKMPAWRTGLKLLRRHNLVFDFLVFQQQMAEAAEIIADNPDILFVIEHSGVPDLQAGEPFDRWRGNITPLAALPNTVMKISGFGMRANSTTWSMELIKPFITTMIDLFGVKRCMFGSNFPLDKVCISYRQMWQDFDDATKGFSEDERAALFHDNAVRVYRL